MIDKVSVFTDLHLGLKNNSKIHNNDCMDFVDWYIKNSKDNNCKIGIFCGDFHHNRNHINISTLDYSLTILEKLGQSFEKFYLMVGNHDLYYKDNRDLKSINYAKHVPNVEIVDTITEVDDITMVPWLVGDEWKQIPKIKSNYIFGHFELPSFYMNAMVKMPDHGELKAEHFKNQKYVFSGHFHKRQVTNNIHYIGNAFPHNYADAWDDDRGMMILDIKNNSEPQYINWDDSPKYRTITLSKLIDEKDKVIKSKTHLRVTLDIDITFEEASFIKETFMQEYDCREITLMQSRQDIDVDSDQDIKKFESVDQIVSNEILAIESEKFDNSTLLNIYNNL